jgi:hypothetical protein
MRGATITAIGWADWDDSDKSAPPIWLKEIVWVNPQNEHLARTRWKTWEQDPENHTLVAMPEFLVAGRWLQVQYVAATDLPEDVTEPLLVWLYCEALSLLGMPMQDPKGCRSYLEYLPWAAYTGLDSKTKVLRFDL